MKKVIKNIFYFVPAVISLTFYMLIGVNAGFGSFDPTVWCFVALLFASAILMMRKKWWGSIGGVITGAVLINMGTQYTGQVISETPIGIVFYVYYIVCGIVCIKSKKPTDTEKE